MRVQAQVGEAHGRLDQLATRQQIALPLSAQHVAHDPRVRLQVMGEQRRMHMVRVGHEVEKAEGAQGSIESEPCASLQRGFPGGARQL